MRNPKLLVLDQTETLSHQVERVTAGLRPRPDVESCDTFDAVDGLIAAAGPFEVLLAGPPVSEEDGLRQLRILRETTPDMRLILVVDHWPAGSLRETLRTGALDILQLPVTDDELLDSVRQALDTVPTPTPTVPSVDEATPGRRPGTVIAVVSATGGCGKTFFATNLAYHLHSRYRKRTCLVDLDLQFGELSTALRLKPRYTITDLVATKVDQDDLAAQLEDHLAHHDSGIHLLAAPIEPADADAVEAEDVGRVIEAARARFDYVVIDTGAALSEPVLAILDQADQIFALATLDLPSVRTLGVLLTTLKRLKVPTGRIKLLLNKVEPDVGIDVAGVSQYFPQGFSMVIPYGREVNRSLNMGQPVLAYAPRGEVSRSLDAGLTSALGLDATGVTGGHERPKQRWPRRPRFGRRHKTSA